jgi:DNA-binding XRE family transcriptional regulator
MGRTKATPALRAEVEALRRAGRPVNRAEIAARHGVGATTVQYVRAEIDKQLAAEGLRPAGGRTVRQFDGAKLLRLRQGGNPSGHWFMQHELGKLAGVSRGEIGHLERGHRKPTIRTLRNLAWALGPECEDQGQCGDPRCERGRHPLDASELLRDGHGTKSLHVA